MVKFKEILEKLGLDLDFDDKLLKINLPVDNIFDKYNYCLECHELNLPPHYNCNCSNDEKWGLSIFLPENIDKDSEAFTLYYDSEDDYEPGMELVVLYSGESYVREIGSLSFVNPPVEYHGPSLSLD